MNLKQENQQLKKEIERLNAIDGKFWLDMKKFDKLVEENNQLKQQRKKID